MIGGRETEYNKTDQTISTNILNLTNVAYQIGKLSDKVEASTSISKTGVFMTLIPIILSALSFVLLLVVLVRQFKGGISENELQTIKKDIAQEIQNFMQSESRGNRQELTGQITNLQQIVNGQLANQDQRLKTFEETYSTKADQLRESLSSAVSFARQEQQSTLGQMNTAIAESLKSITSANNNRLNDIRQVLEDKISGMQTDNAAKLGAFAGNLEKLTNSSNEKLEAMRQSLTRATADARREQTESMNSLRKTVQEQLNATSEANKNGIAEVRSTLEHKISDIQTENSTKLGAVSESINKVTETNSEKMEFMRQSMIEATDKSRREQTQTLQLLSQTMNESIKSMSEGNDKKLAEMRSTLEQKITQLQTQNETKLEEMRKTVDEKLHDTLEQRLGESFRLVSERLENVHKSLGEMNQLAQGVGDLKRVLTNVKTRGTWGEVQLGMILEQMLTSNQYAQNVETVPGSNAIVEYAIKLPGKGITDTPVWLPIDSKFPKEQYERLVQASESGDVVGVASAGKELEAALDIQAKTIANKYISAPYTTDFGLMFLPTEGLYAEVMRRPGLADAIQRKYRINIAGPSTLTALLNSLQMGFKTLAIEKRSSEVWKILGAVKTEFGKFGDVLASTKKALERVTKNIEKAENRTRAMDTRLKSVESLPDSQSMKLLGISDDGIDDLGDESSEDDDES